MVVMVKMVIMIIMVLMVIIVDVVQFIIVSWSIQYHKNKITMQSVNNVFPIYRAAATLTITSWLLFIICYKIN